MTKSIAITTVASLAITPFLAAGIDEVDVLFTMEFEDSTLGEVLLADTFTALQEDLGSGDLGLTFGGDGFFSVSDPGIAYEYTNLQVVLQADEIFGGGDALLDDGGSTSSSTFMFDGFGSIWDGTFASGVGVVEFTPAGGFTTDTYEIEWSVELVPTPGALALLGIAGLAGRRRRG